MTKIEKMKMKDVYNYLSDEIQMWSDSTTFEWERWDIEDECVVYIFDGYISIENIAGNEIYHTTFI